MKKKTEAELYRVQRKHDGNLNFFSVSEWWIIDGSIQASSTGICELSTAAIRVAISQITYSHIEERLSEFSQGQQSGMKKFKINKHHLPNMLLSTHFFFRCYRAVNFAIHSIE